MSLTNFSLNLPKLRLQPNSDIATALCFHQFKKVNKNFIIFGYVQPVISLCHFSGQELILLQIYNLPTEKGSITSLSTLEKSSDELTILAGTSRGYVHRLIVTVTSSKINLQCTTLFYKNSAVTKIITLPDAKNEFYIVSVNGTITHQLIDLFSFESKLTQIIKTHQNFLVLDVKYQNNSLYILTNKSLINYSKEVKNLQKWEPDENRNNLCFDVFPDGKFIVGINSVIFKNGTFLRKLPSKIVGLKCINNYGFLIVDENEVISLAEIIKGDVITSIIGMEITYPSSIFTGIISENKTPDIIEHYGLNSSVNYTIDFNSDENSLLHQIFSS